MGRAARLPYSLKVEVVKLPLTPRALVLEGPHLAILISATRMELQEGRSIGLEFPELPVRALIDTGASLTIINPEIATTCKLNKPDIKRLMLWEERQVNTRSMLRRSRFRAVKFQVWIRLALSRVPLFANHSSRT